MALLSSIELVAIFPEVVNYAASGTEIDWLLSLAEEDLFPPSAWGTRAPRLIALFAMHSLELKKQMADTAGGTIRSISLEDENSEVSFNQVKQSDNWLDDLSRTHYGLLLKALLNTSKKRVFSVGRFSKGPAIPTCGSTVFHLGY
jgi:hypothetical protein